MKTEISAGGIIVRSTKGHWEVLILQDMNDAWTFPKGKLEPGEKPEAAACREIKEEVGLNNLTLLKKLPVSRYMYQKNGLISKTVHYFIFKSKGGEPIVDQTEEGIHNAKWMPLDDALLAIGYKETNLPLLEQTKRFLRSTSS